MIATRSDDAARPAGRHQAEITWIVFGGAPHLSRVRDYSGDGVLAFLEASLGWLGLGRIDVALRHDPDVAGRYSLLDGQAAEGLLPVGGIPGR